MMTRIAFVDFTSCPTVNQYLLLLVPLKTFVMHIIHRALKSFTQGTSALNLKITFGVSVPFFKLLLKNRMTTFKKVTFLKFLSLHSHIY